MRSPRMAVILFAAAVLWSETGQAGVIPVTSSADSGAGTLRDAIDQANAGGPDRDIIALKLPAGAIIDLTSALPVITDTVAILNRDAKNVTVRQRLGASDHEINRTVNICKSRNGRGGGLKLAYQFNAANVCFEELGVILKSAKTDTKGVV